MPSADDTILTALPQSPRSPLENLRAPAAELAQLFVNAMERCAQLMSAAPDERSIRELLDVISAGVARFGSFDTNITVDTVAERAHEPLRQLARAYLRGFEAVGAVALLSQQAPLPAEAEALVQLALKSARTVQQLSDLVFGTPRLGSISSVFTYIGTLENQADALFRAGVMQLARASSTGSSAGGDANTRYRALVSLESLTDRCEEIGETLLLVYWLE